MSRGSAPASGVAANVSSLVAPMEWPSPLKSRAAILVAIHPGDGHEVRELPDKEDRGEPDPPALKAACDSSPGDDRRRRAGEGAGSGDEGAGCSVILEHPGVPLGAPGPVARWPGEAVSEPKASEAGCTHTILGTGLFAYRGDCHRLFSMCR